MESSQDENDVTAHDKSAVINKEDHNIIDDQSSRDICASSS